MFKNGFSNVDILFERPQMAKLRFAIKCFYTLFFIVINTKNHCGSIMGIDLGPSIVTTSIASLLSPIVYPRRH